MKKILLIFILISSVCLAQTENFEVRNRQIEWVKVYDSNLTYDKIYRLLRQNGKFTIADSTKNSISGTFENIDADFRGAGYSAMGTNVAVLNATTKGNFVIDFKEGKYRVSLKNLTNKTRSTLANSALTLMDANSEYTFEFLGLKNASDEFNNTFKTNP